MSENNKGALSGLRVLDLTRVLAGPKIAALMEFLRAVEAEDQGALY